MTVTTMPKPKEQAPSLKTGTPTIGVWVAKSSGYRVLDQEAVATIQRASPLPPIPAEMPDTLNITVPVRFGPPA